MERVIGILGGARQSRTVTMPSTSVMPDDVSLVSAARGGNRAAFGQLYERFSPMVHGILLARVSPSDAEDLVQDVFLTALRQLHALRDDRAFPGWLAKIARNRAHDHYRRALQETQLPEDIPAGKPRTGEAVAVLSTIQKLPDAYREPLILRLVEGMTGDEIASRTGLTPGSVRVNLHRGLRQLREKLGKQGRL